MNAGARTAGTSTFPVHGSIRRKVGVLLAYACWIGAVACFLLSRFAGRPRLGGAVIPFVLAYMMLVVLINLRNRETTAAGRPC